MYDANEGYTRFPVHFDLAETFLCIENLDSIKGDRLYLAIEPTYGNGR